MKKYLEPIIKVILLKSIKLYQGVISPILGPSCRYIPTCSEYAQESIEIHGILKGGYLTLRRLMRCHPLCKHELYDPVPDKGKS